MNIKDELEYRQDYTAISETWTLDTIKNSQRRAMFDNLALTHKSLLLLLDGIVDQVVERAYGDLIAQTEYFQPFCGPVGLVLHNKSKYSGVVEANQTLPMAFDTTITSVDPKWIDELVNHLRVIAIGNMVQNRIFSIYVPFQLIPNGEFVVVKTRYAVHQL